MSELLILIPAPLHAAGMPRAALRPLDGRPLLLRAIDTAAATVKDRSDIVVLADDDEVALFAERQGCLARPYAADRGAEVSGELLTESIEQTVRRLETARAARFAAVMVLRPTAPLLRPADLADAVAQLDSSGAAMIASDDISGHAPHSWPDVGFVVSRRSVAEAGQWGNSAIAVAKVPQERRFTLRAEHDWWICERLLQRKRIVVVVIGYPAVGLGHVSRASIIAHELIHHDVRFLCPSGSELAARQLAAHGLPVHCQEKGADLAASVLALNPDLVLNDALNTERAYIERLQAGGAAVVSFEDLGTGAQAADLVINDIFMERDAPPNHRNGPEYFCIRDEFLHAPPREERADVREVLVTFGGTDSTDCTGRLARLLLPLAKARSIHLSFVTGPGYRHLAELERLLADVAPAAATLAHDTKRISEYMGRADFAFSSAGRTVFELAALRVPGVIVAANAREETHTFARGDNGFLYLGRADAVDDTAIVAAFERLVESADLRRHMAGRMRQWDFRHGRQRVLEAMAPLLARESQGCPA
ncbi:MAG: hypothetical protein AB7P99_20370 [Vicinamibacterales bacterium]